MTSAKANNDAPPKVFTVDARAILTLGRDSIKDHTTALVELVKNSYDADATKVEVEIMTRVAVPCIRIADNGFGMSESDVDNKWLRIGFSSKTLDRLSAKHRRKTGEKGIGRISADRLGAILELSTQSKGNKPFGLIVNWDSFDVANQELDKIPIQVVENPNLKIPKLNDTRSSKSGTELVVKQLRQEWVEEDIQNLHRELATLVSPFKDVKDFEIDLKTDVVEGYDGKVESDFFETAAIRLDAQYSGKGSELKYKLYERIKGRKKSVPGKINWRSLIHRRRRQNREPLNFGPVSLSILFYPQKTDILKGSEFSLSDLRQFLRSNAGVSIYRDSIRVKPYGNPRDEAGDWLGLSRRSASDPAGPSRKTFKVPPNSIVGAVFIGRDKNPKLSDSSAREGLIHGDAFFELRDFVLACIRIIEARYHQSFVDQKEKDRQNVSPSEEVRSLNRELRHLKTDLRAIMEFIPETAGKEIERTVDRVGSVVNQIQVAQRSILELQSQATIYRALATIGIAATVFGHETQSSLAGFVGATYNVSRYLKQSPPNIVDAVASIDTAKKYADQVGSWGKFALARIRTDKRRRGPVDMKLLATEIADALEPAMDAVNIQLMRQFATTEGKTFAMDAEAVLLNLLTNAYTACQQTKRRRVIRVKVSPKKLSNIPGCEMVVADSGPGVANEFRDRVWDPLFSTKVDEDGRQVGTGLGLAIVQSIVSDLKGTKRMDTDTDLKGARFTVWLPLE